MQNFPQDWTTPDALPKLPVKAQALLNRFGEIVGKPTVSTCMTPGADGNSKPIYVVEAMFAELSMARKAVERLDGFDMRPEKLKASGARPSPSDIFSVQLLQATPAADRSAVSTGAAKAGILDTNAGQQASKPMPAAGPAAELNVPEQEESCLLVRGFPPSWGEEQVRFLFVVFGGASSVRFIEDPHFGTASLVELKNSSSLQRAAKDLNDTDVGDGEVIVDECHITCRFIEGRRAKAEAARHPLDEDRKRKDKAGNNLPAEGSKRRKQAREALAKEAEQRALESAAMMKADMEAQWLRQAEAQARAHAEAERLRWEQAEAERIRWEQAREREVEERRRAQQAEEDKAEEERRAREVEEERLTKAKEAEEIERRRRLEAEMEERHAAATEQKRSYTPSRDRRGRRDRGRERSRDRGKEKDRGRDKEKAPDRDRDRDRDRERRGGKERERRRSRDRDRRRKDREEDEKQKEDKRMDDADEAADEATQQDTEDEKVTAPQGWSYPPAQAQPPAAEAPAIAPVSAPATWPQAWGPPPGPPPAHTAYNLPWAPQQGWRPQAQQPIPATAPWGAPQVTQQAPYQPVLPSMYAYPQQAAASALPPQTFEAPSYPSQAPEDGGATNPGGVQFEAEDVATEATSEDNGVVGGDAEDDATEAPTDSEDEGAAPKAAAASSLPAETVPEPTAEELFAGIDTPQADDVDVDGAVNALFELLSATEEQDASAMEAAVAAAAFVAEEEAAAAAAAAAAAQRKDVEYEYNPATCRWEPIDVRKKVAEEQAVHPGGGISFNWRPKQPPAQWNAVPKQQPPWQSARPPWQSTQAGLGASGYAQEATTPRPAGKPAMASSAAAAQNQGTTVKKNSVIQQCSAEAKQDQKSGVCDYPQAMAVRLVIRNEQKPAHIFHCMAEAGLAAGKDHRSTVKAIMKLCHPDKCKHPEAKKAMQILAPLLHQL